jgi:hypothetical protein
MKGIGSDVPYMKTGFARAALSLCSVILIGCEQSNSIQSQPGRGRPSALVTRDNQRHVLNEIIGNLGYEQKETLLKKLQSTDEATYASGLTSVLNALNNSQLAKCGISWAVDTNTATEYWLLVRYTDSNTQMNNCVGEILSQTQPRIHAFGNLGVTWLYIEKSKFGSTYVALKGKLQNKQCGTNYEIAELIDYPFKH